LSSVSGGPLFLLWSLVSFGSGFRIGIDDRPDELVTGGVFAVSRNPIYVAFWFILLGQFLVFPSVALLIYLAAATALFHRQVMREETYLAEHCGAAYAAYRGRAALPLGPRRLHIEEMSASSCWHLLVRPAIQNRAQARHRGRRAWRSASRLASQITIEASCDVPTDCATACGPAQGSFYSFVPHARQTGASMTFRLRQVQQLAQRITLVTVQVA
jgi:Phospholipid methyltransferase